jgi:hypothetical protein
MSPSGEKLGIFESPNNEAGYVLRVDGKPAPVEPSRALGGGGSAAGDRDVNKTGVAGVLPAHRYM